MGAVGASTHGFCLKFVTNQTIFTRKGVETIGNIVLLGCVRTENVEFYIL